MSRMPPLLVLATLVGSSLAGGCSDYLNRSKAAEATANVRAICAAVADYYAQERMQAGEVTSEVLPPAASRAPAQVPCGERQSFSSEPAWDAIGFRPEEPVYYSYEYEPDADGGGFTVRAIGDLDCDQETSLYELHATVADGEVDCGGEIATTDELE